MKTLRKIVTTMIFTLLIVGNIGSVIAQGETIAVENLIVEDSKHVNVMLDNEIDGNGLRNDDLKIMHDISISSAELDIADAKKAMITLNSELTKNTSYNIISITGVDGSMDFETGNNLDGEEILNTIDEGVQSINIINSSTIEINYYDAISSNEIELKLLKDVMINSIISNSNTEFTVTTEEELEARGNYIFMLLAARNTDNSEAEIEPGNGIYNFKTGASLQKAEVEEEVDLNAASEDAKQETSTSTEMVNTETEATEEQEEEEEVVVSTSTTEETTEEVAGESNTGSTATKSGEVNETASGSNIEEVAADVTAVPETGTATNILILLTLLSAAGIHLKRRKK